MITRPSYTTPRGLTIRPASAADAARIAEIYAHYARQSVLIVDVDQPPSRGEWEVRLASAARSDYPTLVTVEAGRVVGYALLSPWITKPAFQHTAENSIYLAPDAVGHGGRLLARLLEAGRTRGIREVLALIADAGNEGQASRALHLRAGFEPVGQLRRVGHKHGRWIDVEVLQRTLDR